MFWPAFPPQPVAQPPRCCFRPSGLASLAGELTPLLLVMLEMRSLRSVGDAESPSWKVEADMGHALYRLVIGCLAGKETELVVVIEWGSVIGIPGPSIQAC